MCVFGCVTTYVDFNLFELQTSKLKMKFSDVQGKKEELGGRGGRILGQHSRTVGATLQVRTTHARVDIHF